MRSLSFSKSLFLSCLALVICAIGVGIRFSLIGFSWLIYTLILLYVGGIMILFVYICSLTSFSKIEMTDFRLGLIAAGWFFFWGLGLSQTTLWSKFKRVNLISSLYFSRSLIIFLVLGNYLIWGLLASVFIIEKNKGPLKSTFYV